MAKKPWWDPTGWFGGGDEEEESSGSSGGGSPIQSQTVVTDPARQAVSDKISEFFTSRLGQPTSPYTGELTTSLDPRAQSRYNEYLGMDPAAWFEKAITQPTLSRFREELLPEVNEAWAGNLRGSGRYRDVEDYSRAVAERLGEVGAKTIPSIYESQLGLGYKQAALEQTNKMTMYNEWIRQQPEYSPVLEQAINYLGGKSGTMTYSYWGAPKSAQATAGVEALNDSWLNKIFDSGFDEFGTQDWVSMGTNIASIVAAFL